MDKQRYDELLENMKKDMFEQLEAVEYIISLDSAIADQPAVGNAVQTLKRAIEKLI